MSVKDNFELLVKSHGFTNINQLCNVVGIASSNLYSNLRNVWGMSIKRMFKIANALNCPVEEVISVLYPEEYEKNQEIVDRVRDKMMKEIAEEQ